MKVSLLYNIFFIRYQKFTWLYLEFVRSPARERGSEDSKIDAHSSKSMVCERLFSTLCRYFEIKEIHSISIDLFIIEKCFRSQSLLLRSITKNKQSTISAKVSENVKYAR